MGYPIGAEGVSKSVGATQDGAGVSAHGRAALGVVRLARSIDEVLRDEADPQFLRASWRGPFYVRPSRLTPFFPRGLLTSNEPHHGGADDRRDGHRIRAGPKLGAAARILYHQVHPLKLATDISTAVGSLVLLAEHHLGLALTVMFVPSILVSATWSASACSRRPMSRSVGTYLRRYMTKTMQGVCLLGMGLVAVGTWVRAWWLLPIGAAVVLWGWFGSWLLDRVRCPASSLSFHNFCAGPYSHARIKHTRSQMEKQSRLNGFELLG